MGKLKSKFIEEKVFVGLMWIAVAMVLLVLSMEHYKGEL